MNGSTFHTNGWPGVAPTVRGSESHPTYISSAADRTNAPLYHHNLPLSTGPLPYGALLIVEVPVAAGAGAVVTPGLGDLQLAGLAPAVLTPRVVLPGLGDLQLTGLAPLLPRVVLPGLGALLLDGLAPTILTPRVLLPGLGSALLDGLAPAVLTPRVLLPGLGAALLNGLAPTVLAGTTVSPPTGALALDGLAPTVLASGATTVNPGLGLLALTGLAPTVIATGAPAPDVYAWFPGDPEFGRGKRYEEYAHPEPQKRASKKERRRQRAIERQRPKGPPVPPPLEPKRPAIPELPKVVIAPPATPPGAYARALAQARPRPAVVCPGTGHLTLIGQAPSVPIFEGLAPTVLTPRVMRPGTGALVFQGCAPSYSTTWAHGDEDAREMALITQLLLADRAPIEDPVPDDEEEELEYV